MDLDKSSNVFFAELLSDTQNKFEQSPIHKIQSQAGKNWSYSVCDTPIAKGRGIIFGINWGGDGNFSPQIQIPDGMGISDYQFIKRSKEFLEKDWDLDFSAVNFNYTNLCFFRSPKASDLTIEDFRLSLPLFEKYVDHIQPPWLLSIGVTNNKILEQLGCLQNIRAFHDDDNKFKGYIAELWGFQVYSVPHPSARLKTKSRLAIWKKVTEEMKRK